MKRVYTVCECDRCHQIIEGEPIKIQAIQQGKKLDMVSKTLEEKDYCLNCVAKMLEFMEPKKAPKPMTLEEFTLQLQKNHLPKTSLEIPMPAVKPPRLKKDGTPWGKSGRKPKNAPEVEKESDILPKLNKGSRAFELTETEKKVLKMWKGDALLKDIAKASGITEEEVEEILLKYADPDK